MNANGSAPLVSPLERGLSRLVPRSLDARDRRMLLTLIALVAVLFTLLAVLTPAEDANRNPVPSSWLTGTHGAKAGYTLLAQNAAQGGYGIERWEEPLTQLVGRAGPNTVVIFAEPYTAGAEDRRAVAAMLRKGARVIATGASGAALLPESHAGPSSQPSFAACEAQPEGLETLAAARDGSASIWIVPSAVWTSPSPETRTAYTCASEPVVVEYPVGPASAAGQPGARQGRAVWWASSTPLENGSIERGANLALLLNSIGPSTTPAGPIHIYWDESLHGDSHTSWDYVHGPLWPLLAGGSALLTLLVLLSFSRRSGPVRPLPRAPRTTPIEFLEALGALYRSAGAASTAMQVAWERFRMQAALLTGQRTAQMDAGQIAFALERRFGSAAAGIAPDLVAAEEACLEDHLKARRALELIRALRRHEETLRGVSRQRPAAAGVTAAH